MSPTYVPDLVQTCLDLPIDRETGIWHLSNAEPVSWAELARRVALLAGLDEKSSLLKDTGLSLSGTFAALAHTPAGDEIVKNTFANYAFEHFEIAAYKSLITMAEDGGFDVSALKQSLSEEQRMAQWIDDNLPTLTRKYATLYAEGGAREAKH